MIRRPPRSTQSRSSAASDVYKRLGEPARQRETEADTGGVVGVTEALEWSEYPVEVGRRDAWAAVDDAQLHAYAETATGNQRRGPGWAVPQGVADQVGDDPFEQAWVGEDDTEVVGHANYHCVPDRTEIVQCQGHHFVEGHRTAHHGQGPGLK